MIRVGIGGWTYEPWRGAFYPEDLPKAQELGYASRALTTIEINSTFYRTQDLDRRARLAQIPKRGALTENTKPSGVSSPQRRKLSGF